MQKTYQIGELYFGKAFPGDRFRKYKYDFFVKNEDGTYSKLLSPFKYTNGKDNFVASELVELKSNPMVVEALLGDKSLETVFYAADLDKLAFDKNGERYEGYIGRKGNRANSFALQKR